MCCAAGRGTLQQIGLLTPSPTLALTLTLLFSGATVFAFGRTLKRALTKDMSPTCAPRIAMCLAVLLQADAETFSSSF